MNENQTTNPENKSEFESISLEVIDIDLATEERMKNENIVLKQHVRTIEENVEKATNVVIEKYQGKDDKKCEELINEINQIKNNLIENEILLTRMIKRKAYVFAVLRNKEALIAAYSPRLEQCQTPKDEMKNFTNEELMEINNAKNEIPQYYIELEYVATAINSLEDSNERLNKKLFTNYYVHNVNRLNEVYE